MAFMSSNGNMNPQLASKTGFSDDDAKSDQGSITNTVCK